jgi:hypothetical protein
MNYFYSEAAVQRIATLQMLVNIVIQPHHGIEIKK